MGKDWSCEEWKPFILMLAIDLAFAIVNILLKQMLDGGMNHLVFITYRLVISASFLGPIDYFAERNTRPRLTPRILCYLFFSAILGTALTQYFFLLGIQYTSAYFSCAFINIVPILTFVMALPFGIETLDITHSSGKAKVLGTLICIAGALILTLYKGKPLINGASSRVGAHQASTPGSKPNSTKRIQNWTIGLICLSSGTVLWSLWFLVQSSISRRYPCQYSSTAIMSFFGSIQAGALSFSTSRSLSVWVLHSKTEILTVLFSGMVGSGLCFVGMSWCVKKRGPVFTAAFSPFIQIMAAIFDIPFLHEELRVGSLVGSVLVMIGLYLLLWGKNQEMQRNVARVAQEAVECKNGETKIEVDEEQGSHRVPSS
ncbi:hypothetical protein MLD38_010200 [Melastoma candidum]|uniref:Uncharacterized protein n=1 Tax=Melastoma candidum TaxID=119954 RepID=A0ACB9QZ28_9MYRT|nr:hypothetical protein MLD38_010200 [Melastoma candidum]